MQPARRTPGTASNASMKTAAYSVAPRSRMGLAVPVSEIALTDISSGQDRGNQDVQWRHEHARHGGACDAMADRLRHVRAPLLRTTFLLSRPVGRPRSLAWRRRRIQTNRLSRISVRTGTDALRSTAGTLPGPGRATSRPACRAGTVTSRAGADQRCVARPFSAEPLAPARLALTRCAAASRISLSKSTLFPWRGLAPPALDSNRPLPNPKRY